MILLLDNFDSFTYNLADYFNQIGLEVLIKKNNCSIQEIQAYTFNAIVISPGPEIPEKAGITSQLIEYYHDKLPILGICLGHQALGEFFGADLIKAPYPKHGKISEIEVKKDAIFKEIPFSFNVTRYHSLVLSNLPQILEVTSKSKDDNQIMSFKHQKLPIWGVQFHPEAVLTQFGIKILENWATFNNLIRL